MKCLFLEVSVRCGIPFTHKIRKITITFHVNKYEYLITIYNNNCLWWVFNKRKTDVNFNNIYIVYILKETCGSHVQGSWGRYTRHDSWKIRYCRKTLISSDCFGIVMSTESPLEWLSLPQMCCWRREKNSLPSARFERFGVTWRSVWIAGQRLWTKFVVKLIFLTSTQRRRIWCFVEFCGKGGSSEHIVRDNYKVGKEYTSKRATVTWYAVTHE